MSDASAESRPTVSILSSVWNEEEHLPAMLASLARQSLPDWELLVVDDASTDATPQILAEAAAADPRIRIVSTGVKLGKVGAFNLGFEHSRGDLIALMAGDDVLTDDSLEGRAVQLPEDVRSRRAVGYFKLLTLSDATKFDGMLLPRGAAGSRSGPSLTMTRPLAELCFPVPPELPSEDSWLGETTQALAETVVDSPHVVVRYRVHGGNSNPRHKDFATMTEAMHKRARAWSLILESDRFELPVAAKERLTTLIRVEELRYGRRTLGILTSPGMPLVDRLANASMSHPVLFRIRTRFYRTFSGWRGR